MLIHVDTLQTKVAQTHCLIIYVEKTCNYDDLNKIMMKEGEKINKINRREKNVAYKASEKNVLTVDFPAFLTSENTNIFFASLCALLEQLSSSSI